MLEKYEKNFDASEFIRSYMDATGLTRAQAEKELRKKIPKEGYFQENIMKSLQRKYRSAMIRKIHLGNYSQAGFPDVLMIMDGHYFGFEVKRPVLGVPSKLQLRTIDMIRSAGGTAEIVVWPEEAIEVVERYMRNKKNQDGG